MPQKRQYTVVHERVVLEFDVEHQSIVGYVELVVLPRTVSLRTIGINCVQLDVLEVLVGGQRAEYVLAHSSTAYRTDAQKGKTSETGDCVGRPDSQGGKTSETSDVKSSTDFKTSDIGIKSSTDSRREMDETSESKNSETVKEIKPLAADLFLDDVRCLKNYDMDLNAKLDIADFGELVITVPQPVRKMVRRAEKEKQEAHENEVDIVSLETKQPDKLLTPILVRIAYQLTRPRAGFQFVEPHRVLFPQRPHQGFVAQSNGTASLWFPCVEGCDERCTFEMELTCPSAYTIVASGVLVKTQFTDADKLFKTFFYRVQTPITPAQLGIAVAPFQVRSCVLRNGYSCVSCVSISCEWNTCVSSRTWFCRLETMYPGGARHGRRE
jgi:hypothetical protein